MAGGTRRVCASDAGYGSGSVADGILEAIVRPSWSAAASPSIKRANHNRAPKWLEEQIDGKEAKCINYKCLVTNYNFRNSIQ